MNRRLPLTQPSPPPGGEGKRGGYTLIEIVIVLLILGLALAVVVPTVGRSVDGIRMRAEVAGVASFLRSAREQAITQKKPYSARVDSDARLLVLTAPGATGMDEVKGTRALRVPVRLEANASGTRVITFLPQGLSSGGHLRVGTTGAASYLITVEPLTGRVTAARADS